MCWKQDECSKQLVLSSRMKLQLPQPMCQNKNMGVNYLMSLCRYNLQRVKDFKTDLEKQNAERLTGGR
jgi:hypothetical protein